MTRVCRLNHLDLTVVELFADGRKTLAQYLQAFERRLSLLSNSNCDLAAGAAADSEACGAEERTCSYFPVLLLSYADLAEGCDMLSLLATRRHDAVLVFAPHFIIGERRRDGSLFD